MNDFFFRFLNRIEMDLKEKNESLKEKKVNENGDGRVMIVELSKVGIMVGNSSSEKN